MRINGGLEEENDRLVQIWATRQKSYVSRRPAQCGHHYYSRWHGLLRWDLENIIPLTYEEHTNHHAGKLPLELPEPRKSYLESLRRKDFKDYLLENNLTKIEFAKVCNEKLKEKISELS